LVKVRKIKDMLGVTVDRDIYNAIQRYCAENKFINRSAMCNYLLRQAMTENGMLESSA
jgi:hypothetical protein